MMRDTQLEAWESVKPDLRERQQKVLELIVKRDGLAGFEIARALGVPHNYISARITELCDKGLIADSGKRRPSPQSGRNQIVWKFTPQREMVFEDRVIGLRFKEEEIEAMLLILKNTTIDLMIGRAGLSATINGLIERFTAAQKRMQ